MSAPFVWIFVCFAAGILSSRVLEYSGWMLLPATVISLLGLRPCRFAVSLSAALLLIFLLGGSSASQQLERYRLNPLRELVRLHNREVVSFEGVLTRTPEISSDYFVLQIEITKVSGVSCRGHARMTVSGEMNERLIIGDRIESFARLRLPKNFRTEGAFDYEQYLRSQEIHVLGSIKSAGLIHKQDADRSIRSYFSRIRMNWIRSTMHIFSPANAGLLRALWLDDRGGLTQNQERVLVDAGIFHVIAISGFHISVLLIILFFILKKIVSFRWAMAVACICLLFYFLVLEGRSSVTRAFLSFLILAFSIWRFEQIRLANWICLSALIQLVLNPQELYDSGFQLTYLSTAAILFLVVPICRKLNHLPAIYRYGSNFLIAGFVIQFVLIPYQIYIFHRIPVYSMFANIIAVPVSSVLIASSTLLMPLPMLATFFRGPVDRIIGCLMDSAGLFADLGVRIMPSPSLHWIFAFYIFLALAIILQQRRIKGAMILAVLVTFAAILFPQQRKPAGALQVHFIDVGQGDAILVEYPDGTFDLVDGGGFFNLEALDTGQAILLPYFCRLGVTKLERVFLTHAHADHMNGLISILRYFPVNELYVTRQPVGADNYQRFLRTIGRTPLTVSLGQTFQQGGVHLMALSPADSAKTNRVANDDSLVLLLQYHGRSILLTGDIEAEAEEAVGLRIASPIAYVKAPHHGSKTSSSAMFLNRLRPRTAFISVGSDNWFGHPHTDVLDRYRKNHVMVYRTDIHGTIKLRITETEAKVSISP